MSSITIFSGAFCQGNEVARRLSEMQGLDLVPDETVTSEASKRFKMSEDKLHCALSGETSVFNRFTHEKERCIAHLKMVLAEMLKKDNLLFFGFAGHLIPKEIGHILRVALIGEKRYRVRVAFEEENLDEKVALKAIQREDERALSWINYLFQKSPWDPLLYDMILPMDKKTANEAVSQIWDYSMREILFPTTSSRKAVDDFALSSRVETVLGKEGHSVSVSAREGLVELTINKHVLLLSRLEEELKRIVMNVPGVAGVETQVGPGYYKSDIYRKMDLKKPSKIMLVDDEREFAETLSERLMMRDMGTAVFYDSEQALSLMDKEEPEVMVLDLKMPGIDGLEVLRHVKEEHPNVEVIVLTGKGSGEDEKVCMNLGAFAFLEKPVDVEVLSQTMRDAYKKVREKGADVTDRED